MGVAGWFHIALFGFLCPVMALRSRRGPKAGAKLPPKRAYLASVAIQSAVLGGLAAAAAGLESVRILPPFSVTGGAIALMLAVFAVHAVVGQHRIRLRIRQRDPKLWLMMPTNGVERALWVCISLAAAIGEEIAYRGVLPELLQRLGAGFPVAVAVCALTFGLAHSTQRWTRAAIVTGFAVLMHLLVAVSGSLYLAMLVHFLHDLWIGLSLAWFAKRDGWDPQAGPGKLGS